MKKWISLKLLCISALIVFFLTFLFSSIPATTYTHEAILEMGFPFPFFSIHASQYNSRPFIHFATSFFIGGFFGDIAILYAVSMLVKMIYNRLQIKKKQLQKN